jgi:hypothetical protein
LLWLVQGQNPFTLFIVLLSRERLTRMVRALKVLRDLSHAPLWSFCGAKMPYSCLAVWRAARTGKSFHGPIIAIHIRTTLHSQVPPLYHFSMFFLFAIRRRKSILSHKAITPGFGGAASWHPSYPVRVVWTRRNSSLVPLFPYCLHFDLEYTTFFSLPLSPLGHCNRSHRPDFGAALQCTTKQWPHPLS